MPCYTYILHAEVNCDREVHLFNVSLLPDGSFCLRRRTFGSLIVIVGSHTYFHSPSDRFLLRLRHLRPKHDFFLFTGSVAHTHPCPQQYGAPRAHAKRVVVARFTIRPSTFLYLSYVYISCTLNKQYPLEKDSIHSLRLSQPAPLAGRYSWNAIISPARREGENRMGCCSVARRLS